VGEHGARANREVSAPDDAPAKHRPNLIRAVWLGEHQFDAGRPDGPAMRLDGSAATGQTPPDAMLSALAACSGIDVVDILAKRRTPVERLSIEVEGERRETPPRRFVRLRVTYTIDGAGIERVHAERAVQLAFEKYCSVAATFAPDISVSTLVVVNGVGGAETVQRIVTGS
jgi:putative redox protein